MSLAKALLVAFLVLATSVASAKVHEMWVVRYNGPGNDQDEARALAVDDSGYLYVTGGSYGSGTQSDYATVKYTPNGDTVWVARYNSPWNSGETAIAVAVDAAGNVPP